MKDKYLYRDMDHFHVPKTKYNRAAEKQMLLDEMEDALETYESRKDGRKKDASRF